MFLKPLLSFLVLGGLIFSLISATLAKTRLKRQARRGLLRRIKVPQGSALSCDTQVSRPNVFPGLFDQPEGLVFDAVIELPLWLDMDKFADAMYHNVGEGRGSRSIAGFERCFLYEKFEWILSLAVQISPKVARSCLLKFICETQAIHAFHPHSPSSVLFELLHLILSPSLGSHNSCDRAYKLAEDKGRFYGRCERYEIACPFSVAELLIHNFFPTGQNHNEKQAQAKAVHVKEPDWTDHRQRLVTLRKFL